MITERCKLKNCLDYESALIEVKKENPKFLAKYICKINNTYNKLIDRIIKLQQIEKKYNKALEILIGYNIPCDIDEFNIKNADYCSTNCSVDDDIFIKCWDKYIEGEIKDESN